MPDARHLKQAFFEFVKLHQIIPPGTSVLVAVSGGQDSVALLDLLVQWQKGLNVQLGVAHVHHHLRDGADADAAFVETLAAQYDLPFFRKDVNVKQWVATRKLSIEEGARMLREKALKAIASQNGYEWIATAHTLSDQVETLLMRLFLGTGLTGLAGIRMKRPPFIRPLLFARREEITRYIRSRGLAFREDETNQDTRFLRNRLRWQVIPEIKKHFPEFREEAMGNLALVASEWAEFIDRQTLTAWETVVRQQTDFKIELELSAFWQYFSGIQFKLIEKAVATLKGEHRYLGYHKFKHLIHWLQLPVHRPEFYLDSDMVANRQAARLILFHLTKLLYWRQQFSGTPVPFNTPVPLLDKVLMVTPVHNVVKVPADQPNVEYVDARCITVPLVIGFPEENQVFRPLGSAHSVPVLQFLKKAGVPYTMRQFTPLLLSGNTVVAIPGMRINEQCKITSKTNHVIKIALWESHENARYHSS